MVGIEYYKPEDIDAPPTESDKAHLEAVIKADGKRERWSITLARECIDDCIRGLTSAYRGEFMAYGGIVSVDTTITVAAEIEPESVRRRVSSYINEGAICVAAIKTHELSPDQADRSDTTLGRLADLCASRGRPFICITEDNLHEPGVLELSGDRLPAVAV